MTVPFNTDKGGGPRFERTFKGTGSGKPLYRSCSVKRFPERRIPQWLSAVCQLLGCSKSFLQTGQGIVKPLRLSGIMEDNDDGIVERSGEGIMDGNDEGLDGEEGEEWTIEEDEVDLPWTRKCSAQSNSVQLWISQKDISRNLETARRCWEGIPGPGSGLFQDALERQGLWRSWGKKKKKNIQFRTCERSIKVEAPTLYIQ
ncbi:hypothetical protein C8J56DRAFT_896001 [Mycena floridula]|nr:hypothetical protein C8J56DRAFT_896001 [Mycena floridula]